MSRRLHKIAAIVALATSMPATAQTCIGDVVADGRVDGGDLGVMLSNWGPVDPTNPFSQACDIDGNGQVNGADLGLLLSNWGSCPMVITGLSPSQGCFLGGTEITISGEWIGQSTAVEIGGLACVNVTPVSSSMVKATTPAGTLGPASVVVTAPSGTVTAPQTFTYMPASVTSIVPSVGTTSGGLQITITGAYLALTTEVTIGGVPATNVSVVDSSTVTAVTPPGIIGAVDVVVTGAKGSITIPGGFQYSIIVPSWATLVEAQPNPAVVTDPTLRAEISATRLAWRVRHTVTQMEMLLVPPGTFQMGCIVGSNQHECYPYEQPVHQVTLTNAFYLGRYEVTQAQWMSIMGSNPSFFQSASAQVPAAQISNRPVERVSWIAVRSYCRSLGGRLPTEAEWEYACRAGTQTPFYNGSTDDNTLGALAWYSLNSGNQTRPVGGKAANALGFYDMLGNIGEWVNDLYGDYSSDPQTNPAGPAASGPFVRRGGSWTDGSPGNAVRTSNRDPVSGSNLIATLGFRVARDP
jgi:formylglycine-generating enzyme required for sulfatase activity